MTRGALGKGGGHLEFSEKLQKLRAEKNMTQEELAQQLYVSRTAISKWESGRGYPSIESLKAMAQFFHVTIDELISGDEMAFLAEQKIREGRERSAALICGALDCLLILLLVAPSFGQQSGDVIIAVGLLGLTQVPRWIKAVYLCIVLTTALNGLAGVAMSNFEKPVWNQRSTYTGLALSVMGTAFFMVSRQPYAGAYYLGTLVVKGVLLLRQQ